MKSIKTILLLAVLTVGLLPATLNAVLFTITPNVVSNTYSGMITLQVTNIQTGDTVVVQKFLDANTNGVIDGSDYLVQQYSLTDGQAGMVIGGVTNYNVPGDMNTATGAITSVQAFQNGDFVQNIVGRFFYRLSSPVGHFTPLTNSFTVTNFPFAQKFTGNVVSNSTSTTLSNALVIIFPGPRTGHNGLGNPLAGTVANSAGNYSIMVPTGTYTLVAFATNYMYAAKKAPVVTLGSSQTVTTNLTLTNATASITGTFVDAANSAIVLPGLFMPAQCTNGFISICFSDTNGNYNARVNAATWSLGSDDKGLTIHGYVGLNNSLSTNSGATGVKLAYSKANAMFYGSVKDNLGNAMAAIDVNDYDTVSNLYQSDGFTDTNGNYFVGAVGVGSNNPWQVSLGDTGVPTNYDFTQPQLDQNGVTNLTAGTASLQNITGILATNLITGNVQDSNGTNIVGVNIYTYATINGITYQDSLDTDTNGNYVLNVANGTWDVRVSCSGGNDSLSALGSYACPSDQLTQISNNNAVDNFTVQLCGGIALSPLSPLPTGEVNVFYDQNIQASDCSGNYNWSQTGGSLPGNLGFNSGGSTYTLSGYPGASGSFNFTVQVNDGSGNTTNRQYTVAISNAVQVTTATLPNAISTVNYSQQLQASAGVPFSGAVPYSWVLPGGPGSLPANLTLSTNGILSGTPTVTGNFTFTVEADDSVGGYYDQSLSLNILNTNVPPLAVSSAGGQVYIFWPASAGTNFTVQMTTNLTTGPWVTATNGVPQNAFSFSNSAPSVFFRLQL